MLIRFLVLGISISLAACSGGSVPPANNPPSSGSSGGTSPAPAPTPKPFADVTAASNIQFVHGLTLPAAADTVAGWVSDSTFGGIAAGDCDLDGDIDLFFTYGDAGSPAGSPNRLYLNQLDTGNALLFDDVASGELAYTNNGIDRNDRHSGPAFADLDGDGDLDLFVGGLYDDPNLIFENEGLGSCSFRNVTSNSPDIESLLTDHTISAGFGDFDLDGDLDLFLTHWGSRDEYLANGESEHLFRNVSDASGIRFENVSQVTDVTALMLLGRDYLTEPLLDDASYTATFARINDDLWPDLALASDFGTAQLLINDIPVSGTFRDATNDAVRSVEYGMGSALGDIDSDGDLDWFVTSIFARNDISGFPHTGNRLFRNPGGDFTVTGFENITDSAGVADGGGYGWGACFLDIDNDTDLDIYHTNGFEDTIGGQDFSTEGSIVFLSAGDGTFTDWSSDSGLALRNSSRAIVCADLDRDGDIDIVQQSNDATNSVTLWENVSAAAGRSFLRVRLVGLPPNTEAAGARIYVRILPESDPNSVEQMREIMIGSNYTSQNPTEQVFGLGTASSIAMVRVEWPGLMPGPGQATEWSRADVPTGAAGETLVICHPDLVSPPAVCSPPD